MVLTGAGVSTNKRSFIFLEIVDEDALEVERRAHFQQRSAFDILCRAAAAPYRQYPDCLWKTDDRFSLLLRDARRKAIAPGGLDEHAPSLAVAGFGDATTPDPLLRRHQAEIHNQMASALDASQIADRGDKCCG
ncbi:hypothetical protein AB7M49_007843 [Bradyrhizobium elkanii]|uniref:hypothetical protein n=1 Tax=unclassified Bradyrhizobium TaxID=2631580 RepID=UPI001FD88C64|nr:MULTISPECIES: hypothetical protein [Bradyrhizobium]MCS3448505.1 hypothetical protein [Bradyrhizobium elkanii]MCS3560354.1 hypothetical protein [Bradyrhizobium elkanii]MCW2149802.1 hypothetical protein [Bradyrhizobium elkanii]MCW2360231.1 hypothetical protein [Bradyrhizobium elkanii]MCW2373531.1 hypothetical protein [Bradyrhizobium elkanii]